MEQVWIILIGLQESLIVAMGLIFAQIYGTLAMAPMTDIGMILNVAILTVLFVKNEEVNFMLFTKVS